MECESTSDGLRVAVPSFRPDITIPEDLVEEVLRMGEYGKPAQRDRIAANRTSAESPERPADRLRALLAARGLSEIVTWAFVPKASLVAIADGDAGLGDGIVVKNPISADYEVMRTSLLPGLADALKRNLSRGLSDVWLFEVGTVVRRGPTADAAPVETDQVAGILTGRREGWLKPGEPLDFFDLKGGVEAVLQGFGTCEVDFVAPASLPFLHPGVSAQIRTRDGKLLGHLGELGPVVARRLGIECAAHYFELDLAALAGSAAPLRGTAPPRFPAVSRDVSFWIDVAVPAAAQRAAFLSAAEPLLCELGILEDFRDPKYTPAGKKGQLWSMTYRAADRTLTDAEADEAHRRVVQAVSSAFPIQIR
jgi:phenylalanyl-tRNA synthetase beta chain